MDDVEKLEKKRERQRLAQQKYRLKHPEKSKEYRINNAEKEAKRHKLYQEKNQAKIKGRRKKWHIKNKERLNANGRAYYHAHAETIKIRTTLRNKNNREQLKVFKAKNRYGIIPKEYFIIFEKQDLKCPICYCDIYPWHKNTHIDHDHKTKKVRGLLCGDCNKAIGLLKDDLVALERAIKYLKK